MRWKTQPRSFLWLRTKAGSGKTVLSSTIIDKIEDDKLGGLAYFYFSFQNKEPQDIRHFNLPTAFRELRDAYYPSTDPKMEELDAAILDLLNASKNTFTVIDALDECFTADGPKVVSFLAQLCRTTTSNGIHILITSRHEDYIETTVKNIPNNHSVVTFEVDEVNKHIRDHVASMAEEPYRSWSESLKTTVLNRLTGLSAGVFRWADLQFQELRGKERQRDVKKALERLTRTLEETYERMLERIEKEGYEAEALAVLRWLAYSTRPLLLREVAEVAAFEIDEDEQPKDGDYSVSFTIDDRFPSSTGIRRILAGLVIVSGIDDRSSSSIDSETNPLPWEVGAYM
ncbi:hypothetical protein NKR23_g4356 [Pleurostoma richardsiae]|uniref:NACHT domain-containing protein n=1 Tax=Pleurostoma richardsiae TaxID=41990 RepID=A0AA38S541_9PEZI|nr:hypothetical protein NKR23_g4356 [Pleurostoma richardsiae]